MQEVLWLVRVKLLALWRAQLCRMTLTLNIRLCSSTHLSLPVVSE